MQRREFIGLIGGAAALPFAAQAQQKLPLIGFMDLGSFTKDEILRGLSDNGFVRARDFTDEDTWGEHRPEAWANQAAHLVRRGAALIIANQQAAFAAKAATRSVPIVFQAGFDPVAAGLVESLDRPGGNVTGISMLGTTLIAKRLELLHEIVPGVKMIAYFRNAVNVETSGLETAALQSAASSLGLQLMVQDVNAWHVIEDAFVDITRRGAGGLIVGSDLVYWTVRGTLADLAAKYKVPAIYSLRQYVQAGGLMSYGVRFLDGSYTMGVYAARILRGERPSELPVQQVTTTELFLNLKAARALGLSVPLALQVRADEVIE